MASSYIEKRTFQRVSASIDARFTHGNKFYCGIITDLSERGMFIRTALCLPLETMFIVIARVDSNLMQAMARVKRTERTHGVCLGSGVEIINPSRDYIEYVRSLGS